MSAERQAIALARRGHAVAIVAPGERFSNYEERIEGLRVFRVKSLPLGSDRWRMTALAGPSVARVLDCHRPDLVVLSLPFLLNRAVAAEAEKRGLPQVGILGTMPEWLLYNLGFLKPLGARLYCRIWDMIADFYNRTDHVITPTHTALALIREHGLERPAQVVSNGVELDKFHPRPPAGELARRLGIPNRPAVLYTGRLDAEKRLDVLIKAIPLVLPHVEAHFIVGGNGSERARLAEMAEELGVKDHVTFTGFLATEDYQSIYSLADVFAIASPAELQSIVTLEAMASGLPIVGVNAGALPELAVEGCNGFLFAEGDSEGLARALARLLSDRELAVRFGVESRSLARQHDIARSFEQYERLYRELAGTRERLHAA